MIVLAVIALIFIGPKQLPDIARVVGRMINEFRRATEDLSGSFFEARDKVDKFGRQQEEEIQSKLETQAKPLAKAPPHESDKLEEKTETTLEDKKDEHRG